MIQYHLDGEGLFSLSDLTAQSNTAYLDTKMLFKAFLRQKDLQ